MKFLKSFLRWIWIIATIVIVVAIWFTFTKFVKADDNQQTQTQIFASQQEEQIQDKPKNEDPITILRKEAVKIGKYLKEKRITSLKDLTISIQEKVRIEKNHAEEKELNDLRRLLESLQMTKDFVDGGGIQETESYLIVGYDSYRGEISPVWKDFSEDLSKLKKFEFDK